MTTVDNPLSRVAPLARLLIVALIAIIAAPAFAAETEAPATMPDTCWGPMPERTDSCTAAFADPPRSLAAETLRLPWRIAGLPLKVGTVMLREGIILADEYGVAGKVARLLGPMRGPFGAYLRPVFGGADGIGFGVDTRHHALFGPGNRMRLLGKASLNGSSLVTLGLHFDADRARGYLLGGGYNLLTSARYYGAGPSAPRGDESRYTRELTWCGAGVNQRLFAGVMATASVWYSSVAARGPQHLGDDHVALTDVFARPPTGYGDRSEGLIARIALVRDTTDEDGRPASGGVQGFTVSRFFATGDGGEDFVSLLAELERYLPVIKSGQTLAVRGYFHWIAADDVAAIPFQRLLTNENPYTLRGCDDFRWRDRGLTAVSVEYRWPLWANKRADRLGLDLYLFSDHGQVFGHLDEIGGDNLTHSFGGGVRLIGNGGYAGRIEVGHGEEGAIWRLQFCQNFQVAKGGVLNGFSQTVLH